MPFLKNNFTEPFFNYISQPENVYYAIQLQNKHHLV